MLCIWFPLHMTCLTLSGVKTHRDGMVHFSECSTVAANCSTETQMEMRDGTVENFPELLQEDVDVQAAHSVQQVHRLALL